MSQRISQNLCFKFSIIKNGKINFAFDPAEKPDTLEPSTNPQKGGKKMYIKMFLRVYECYLYVNHVSYVYKIV